jgi:phage repressor protein C with HTH and peptisase S24 domain
MVKVLLRQSARKLDLQSLNPNHEDRSLLVEEIDWMARVVWASK